jgi:transcriptional regulator with XRE-family HTH domain
VSGDELRQRREAAGITIEQLASELLVSPRRVRRWEESAAELMPLRSRHIAALLQRHEFDRILAAEGLPECAARRALTPRSRRGWGWAPDAEGYNELVKHLLACPLCRARDAALEARGLKAVDITPSDPSELRRMVLETRVDELLARTPLVMALTAVAVLSILFAPQRVADIIAVLAIVATIWIARR